MFFIIVFTVYGLINLYIYVRGLSIIPGGSTGAVLSTIVFVLLVAAFPAGRFLERVSVSPLSTTITWVGSFWLAVMVYLFLSVLVIDLLRLVNAVVPFFPAPVAEHPRTAGRIAAAAVCALTLLAVVGGHINALKPRITELTLDVPKHTDGIPSLHIVAASDIHLGTIVSRYRLKGIVEQINSLHPDLVLLPGDVVDEDLGPVIRQNLGEWLLKIRAPLGVYAVTGNHEYIGGVEEACRYLANHGITMLRDSTVKLPGGIYLAGREDRSIRGFAHRQRRPLQDLLTGIPAGSPVILMDHQPFQLDEAEQCGVDLQLSGHTHHGQLWPFNFITGKVYEVSQGYKRKGSTHYYVSAGVGTWGPPVRTGNRPEIVSIHVHFD